MAMTKRSLKKSNAPVPPPTQTENPFRKVFAAAGVLLMLVLSIPMFSDAVYSQSVPQNPLGDQTTALIGALTTLGSQIGLLKEDIVKLRTQLSGQTSTTAAAGAGTIDAGMADCLQSCRSRLAVCLTRQPVRGTASVNAPLDACRTSANDCMNRCKPRPVDTVTCEDRCAVALGGCVVQAGSSATKLDECRIQNRKCVVASCRPRTDTGASERVPSDICRDQCRRDTEICKKAAAYDKDELLACESVGRKCLNEVCANYEAPSLSAGQILSQPIQQLPLGGSETPVSKTVSCTEDCTTSFGACRNAAGRDTAAVQTCEETLGSCQKTC
ncbi:MAG: hypothetical protein WC787_00820 [Patescibacteria group bacterium]|jgi:hypothetical protein